MRTLAILALVIAAGCNSGSARPPSPQKIAFGTFVNGLFASNADEPVEINDLSFVDTDVEDESLFSAVIR